MATLFEDTFTVKEKDPGGRKFDRVSRLVCKNQSLEMAMFLDVNTDIYPVEVGQRLQLVLAGTLNLDGKPMDESFDPSVLDAGRPTLADKFEYVMHGKVFRFVEDRSPGQKVAVFVSFGGLLLMLKGDPRALSLIELDSRVFLLIRKII